MPLLAVAWLGCTKDVPTAPEHPSQSVASVRTITGRILGPDGRNICRTVGEGTMIVYLLNPEFDFTNTDFFDVQEVTCPDNLFSVSQEAPVAHLRVELPINENLGALPWRHLEAEFTVPQGGVHHPVHILEGTPLDGRATLEGRPIEGAPLGVAYAFNPNYGATSGGSGPDGRWVEFFGRAPMILQTGVRYQVFGCEGVLGAKQADLSPSEGFLFPSSRHAVNCRLETGPTTRFSHTATRVAVTPMPGDIGGALSGDLFEQYGVGWGVQFPVPLGESPEHGPISLSQMFNGGLIIGIPPQEGNPARVLAGVDVSSAGMECAPFCRDLGFDGVVTFEPTGASGERKHVTWRYSDAGSVEGVGLQVIQHSLDGIRPHDYVLFRFRIRNTGPARVRFFAGFFGDWDVQPDAFDDRGATALNGRLMYQVSENEPSVYIGTLLLGEAPVTGNYFFNFEQALSVADQIRALRGGLRATTAGPSDLRYIQGAGPITLDPRESQDVWMAVVAGESRSQLVANANAARDHVSRLVNSAISDPSETATMTTVRSSTPARVHRPICKSNCRPK